MSRNHKRQTYPRFLGDRIRVLAENVASDWKHPKAMKFLDELEDRVEELITRDPASVTAILESMREFSTEEAHDCLRSMAEATCVEDVFPVVSADGSDLAFQTRRLLCIPLLFIRDVEEALSIQGTIASGPLRDTLAESASAHGLLKGVDSADLLPRLFTLEEVRNLGFRGTHSLLWNFPGEHLFSPEPQTLSKYDAVMGNGAILQVRMLLGIMAGDPEGFCPLREEDDSEEAASALESKVSAWRDENEPLWQEYCRKNGFGEGTNVLLGWPDEPFEACRRTLVHASDRSFETSLRNVLHDASDEEGVATRVEPFQENGTLGVRVLFKKSSQTEPFCVVERHAFDFEYPSHFSECVKDCLKAVGILEGDDTSITKDTTDKNQENNMVRSLQEEAQRELETDEAEFDAVFKSMSGFDYTNKKTTVH